MTVVDLTPSVLDIKVPQFLPWSLSLTYDDENGAPVNLTNYTASLTVRQRRGADAVFTLTKNDGITLGSSTSNLVIACSEARALLLTGFLYVYDLKLISVSLVPAKPIKGEIIVEQGVTS